MRDTKKSKQEKLCREVRGGNNTTGGSASLRRRKESENYYRNPRKGLSEGSGLIAKPKKNSHGGDVGGGSNKRSDMFPIRIDAWRVLWGVAIHIGRVKRKDNEGLKRRKTDLKPLHKKRAKNGNHI